MGAAVLPVLHGLMHKEDQEDFDFPSITPHCHGSGTNNCWDDGQATRPYIVRPGRSILFARLRVEFKVCAATTTRACALDGSHLLAYLSTGRPPHPHLRNPFCLVS